MHIPHSQPDEHFPVLFCFLTPKPSCPSFAPNESLAERALAKRAVVFFYTTVKKSSFEEREGGDSMGEASRFVMWVFFFEVQLKEDIAYYPPSLKNLLGIRRLGQGWPRILRACSQQTLFLEPVTTITAVRQTK